MCWLCAYQGEALGARLTTFIVRHVGLMDSRCIAQQVSDFLLLQVPEAADADVDSVHEHISRHMLHPRVRIAVTLRQLLDFLSILQTSLVVTEGDACTIDKSNAELYLKVIEKVLVLYKVDTTGMMFEDDRLSAAAASNHTNNNNNMSDAAPSSASIV